MPIDIEKLDSPYVLVPGEETVFGALYGLILREGHADWHLVVDLGDGRFGVIRFSELGRLGEDLGAGFLYTPLRELVGDGIPEAVLVDQSAMGMAKATDLAYTSPGGVVVVTDQGKCVGVVPFQTLGGLEGKPEFEVLLSAAREAAMTHAAPPTLPPVEDDRRLGVDAWLDGQLLKHALVAGRKTAIEVSIGPKGEATKQVPEPLELDFGERDMLSLPVRFMHEDGAVEQQTMHLRRDPRTRGAVTFEVTPTGTHFGALIVVYEEDGSTVIEGAALSAAVVATEEEQQRSPETFQLVRVPAAGLAAPSTDKVGSVVTDGERAIVSAPQIPIRATTEAAVAGVAPVVNTFRTTARNYVAKHGAYDITEALVVAARAGYRLRTRLHLDELRHLDRIQVISFYAQSTFPMELVYDGEPPEDGATPCDGWQQALETGTWESGTCPSCTEPADTAHICPFRFWGLRKVIEHYNGGNTVDSIPFAARSQSISQGVGAPSSTVIGASAKVIEALAQGASPGAEWEALLAEVKAEADEFGTSSVVHDWKEWRAKIGDASPNLLIAMPHQGVKDGAPALELGGEYEDTFGEGYIRMPGNTVRPIVLLLGCDTSTAADLIGSFATDMRPYASVVIATIGKVVAEEAPIVASIIIRSLKHAMRKPGATLGTALLEARRALLAESRVVGLLLVGHGDARWDVQAP